MMIRADACGGRRADWLGLHAPCPARPACGQPAVLQSGVGFLPEVGEISASGAEQPGIKMHKPNVPVPLTSVLILSSYICVSLPNN
jgi:hypothetical protein